MNLAEALAAAQDLAKAVPTLFEHVTMELAFGATARPIGDWSDPLHPGMLVTGDPIGRRSGVYFLCAPDGEIVYIGKAGDRNLHQRVWSHLATPSEVVDGRRTFPQHRFQAAHYCPKLGQQITAGEITLGVIMISECSVVSLVEVYLQTLHAKVSGCLPQLNLRIG